MKGKRNRLRKVISILCMILVFTLAVPCIAEAAPVTWSLDTGSSKVIWTAPGRKDYVYINKNALYQHVNGKDKKIASWKMKENDYIPTIVYGRGDWIYVNKSNTLYGVNLKSKAKKMVIRNYYTVGLRGNGYGPYIYGSTEGIKDGYVAAYVWKLSGGTAKKVSTLGPHVRAVLIYGNKLFVEQYPDNGYMTHFVLDRCNPNGTGKKQQFSLKVGKNGYVNTTDFDETSIGVVVIDREAKKSSMYSYDVNTGKLTLVNENTLG